MSGRALVQVGSVSWKAPVDEELLLGRLQAESCLFRFCSLSLGPLSSLTP